MYKQVEKPKETKSRAVANTVAQKKSNVKEGFGFMDSRLKNHVENKLINIKNTRSLTLQLARTEDWLRGPNKMNYKQILIEVAKEWPPGMFSENDEPADWMREILREMDVEEKKYTKEEYIIEASIRLTNGLRRSEGDNSSDDDSSDTDGSDRDSEDLTTPSSHSLPTPKDNYDTIIFETLKNIQDDDRTVKIQGKRPSHKDVTLTMVKSFIAQGHAFTIAQVQDLCKEQPRIGEYLDAINRYYSFKARGKYSL